MKIPLFGIHHRHILIRFSILLLIVTTLLAMIYMIPQYVTFAYQQFIMFQSFNDVLTYFMLKLPGFACDACIYALIITCLILFYYLNTSHIKKQMKLSGYNTGIIKYLLLSLCIIILATVFIIKENHTLKLTTRADNLIYKGWHSISQNPAIFKGTTGVLYINSLEKSGKQEIMYDVFFDALDRPTPYIITAASARFGDREIIFSNGIKNYLGKTTMTKHFKELRIKFSAGSDQNLLINSIMSMSPAGIKKIKARQRAPQTSFIKVQNRIRYISLFTGLIVIISLFIVFFDLDLRSMFYYLTFIISMIALRILLEYTMKNIFLIF